MALAAQGTAFRPSADRNTLANMVSETFPWPEPELTIDDITELQCSGTAMWTATDVQRFIVAQTGVDPARLREMFIPGSGEPLGMSTFGELGFGHGSSVQVFPCWCAWCPVCCFEGMLLELAFVVQVVIAAKDQQSAARPKRSTSLSFGKIDRKRRAQTARELAAAGDERAEQAGEAGWRAAVDLYSQAIQLTSVDRNVFLQDLLSKRGLNQGRLGRWRHAWLDHDRALSTASTSTLRSLHRYNRGSCAVRLGMLEEAEADLLFAADHGYDSISTGAHRQLQSLGCPLRRAFEGQQEWLAAYYPSLVQLPEGCSVEAFRGM
jgi:hypothetical protein